MKKNNLCVFACCFALTLLTAGCGVQIYPGQPGVFTDSYAKIDMEQLEAEGLYAYEVSYDNRAGGSGVGAIITKLYPNATTYTSNVRTNADGSVYRVKAQYKGAIVEMISIPAENQVIMPPDTTVQMFLTYQTSTDEVDDQNIAEQSLFVPAKKLVTKIGHALQLRYDLIRAAHLTTEGNLSFVINAIDLAGHTFTPSKAISVQTNFFQTGVQTSMTPDLRQEATQFIEQNFPTGFKGNLTFHVQGSATPITVAVGIHTINTAEKAGIKIVRNANQAMIQSTIARFSSSVK